MSNRISNVLRNLNQWLRPQHSREESSETESSSTFVGLIVGLGNPGTQYEKTRHNVGERWVRDLASHHSIELKPNSRFSGWLGRGTIADHTVRLLIPTTFMNLSGRSVGALARYYKVEPNRIMVVYDEVAFPAGVTKLKVGGGMNGHNGLESVAQGLGNNKEFIRLRIGVGHPGDPQAMNRYLTKVDMPTKEQELVTRASYLSDEILKDLLSGELQRAMTALHTRTPSN